jgi:tRNA/tmRNA/rRNA uracil-C5-methylase (TrmA/RlmC/RlmD family)
VDSAQTIDLEITGVAHGGIFVARHEGRVIFVSDAIPGERVRARITDASRPAFWRAEAVEVLEASDDRRPHVWPEADVARPPHERPGGADFGHIRLEAQRELKGRVLREAFERFAHLPVDVTVEPAGAGESPDGTGWRTRLSLHVGPDGVVGPYAARSHHVVPVSSHPLAAPPLADAALGLGIRRGDRVDLVLPSDGQVRIIERTDAAGPRRGARGGSRRATRASDAAEREVVVETVNGRAFRVDAGGFWQVHRLAATTLADALAKSLRGAGFDPDAPNLDLYGGVGLFAAVMGDVGGPVTRVATVESAPRATHHAAGNLREWGNAEAITARVDRFLSAKVADASEASGSLSGAYRDATVLLDPPRAGAGAEVVRSITALAPRTVVYVACDPVALARDTATFIAEGYGMRDLRALDLFPHSHHLEAVAVFGRDAGRAATGSAASRG